MTEQQSASNELWRGVDLSGITLVLGIGTGQLVELLAEEAQRAGGTVVLTSYSRAALSAHFDRVGPLPIERLCCRARELPLADSSVDLCVVNGSLREVPPAHYRAFLEELWRVLVPGGAVRISDLLPPSDALYGRAWRQRCDLITHLGEALGVPVALYADVRALAEAMQAVGFESMAVSLLPGYGLTDDWLSETVEAVTTMLSRVADPETRRTLRDVELPALIAAYRLGDQRAAERFVTRGNKIGDLALDMETAGTEQELAPRDDDDDHHHGGGALGEPRP
ncbi:MAG: class I SAM-dependent methyltransferase [Anaerolineales bacterium]